MTSWPASRSARATTFAPRSCPSSPGLAIRIRNRLSAIPAILVHCIANPAVRSRNPKGEARPATGSSGLPRGCAPPRPTRRPVSKDGRLLPAAEDIAQGVADLPHRAVGPHAVEDERHGVVGARRAAPQGVQGALDRPGVAPRLDRLEPGDLALGEIVGDVEGVD